MIIMIKRNSTITMMFLWFLATSCTDCKGLAALAKEEECFLIIHNKALDINQFFKGKNPFTGKECDCTNDFRWYSLHDEYMDIGDTIIKKKGELFFTIHKKDTILSFDWECEGKVYK